MKPLTVDQALHRAAAYCSKAERCIRDVKSKLASWEISEPDQGVILRRLQQEKFLDESRFCRSFVHDKTQYSKWGSQKIKYELKNRNIPNELIQEALSGIDSEDNLLRLKQLLQAKKKSIRGKNEFEIRQKLMRFAVGRGFSLDEIGKVFSQEKFPDSF